MSVTDMVQVLTHKDPAHASGALLRLNDLRREGILCDLTIRVEGREYKAHKAVMAACSDYFLNAICGGKTTATVSTGSRGYVTVDLEHVTLRGFAPLLEYAYTANLQVNASDVIDVLSAASYMQMFKVASACSEFMRSNLMWSQSRFPNFNNSGSRSRSPKQSSLPLPNLPSEVSSILNAATAAGRVGAMGQPPLLIPMHSLAYDVGFHQLAATMSGSQALTLRDSSSPSQRHLSQSPRLWTPNSDSKNDASGSKSSTYDHAIRDAYKRSSSGHGKGSRKSLAVKLEARTDDEDSPSSLNGNNNEGGNSKSASPAGSEPMEDSWQAIQKMYSMRMQPDDSHADRRNMTSPCERSSDRKDSNEPVDGKPAAGSLYKSKDEDEKGLTNKNINNNNNINLVRNEIEHYQNAERPHTAMSSSTLLNVAVRNSFLNQQQDELKSDAHGGQDQSKLLNLPAVPPNGQYMSVRRRTLQSSVPKPHQCQICGSRFTRFHNLKQHIKLHSGIKPYECDECGKRFTRNYTLRLHKMKHVGIRNFRCGTCDASFTSLGEFRAHLRLTMHSHVPGNPAHGHQSPPASNSESEDLSSPMALLNSIPNRKQMKYDAALASLQRSFMGERASLLSAALGSMARSVDGTGSAGSSCGEGSPRMSDRSLSPQDLSTKGDFQGDEGTGPNSDKAEDNASENPATNRDSENSELNEDMEHHTPPAKEEQPASPAPEHEDSSSEKDQDDRDMPNDSVNGYMEHEDSGVNESNEAEGKKSASGAPNDHPLSLVVNASA